MYLHMSRITQTKHVILTCCSHYKDERENKNKSLYRVVINHCYLRVLLALCGGCCCMAWVSSECKRFTVLQLLFSLFYILSYQRQLRSILVCFTHEEPERHVSCLVQHYVTNAH